MNRVVPKRRRYSRSHLEEAVSLEDRLEAALAYIGALEHDLASIIPTDEARKAIAVGWRRKAFGGRS